MGVPTRVVSWSEVDALRQCALKHRLGHIERWREPGESETLSRGKLFHEVMEAHYSRIAMTQHGLTEDPADAAALSSHVAPLLWDTEGGGGQTPRQALVEWMYRGYVDCYKTDPDWRIVAVEHPFEVWLPATGGARSSFRLKGKIDLIVRDMSAGGGLWIVDHKSMKNLPKGRELDLDDQFTLYEWGMRQRGNDIRGIIYNAVRTERLKTREMQHKERFKRAYTVRSQTELDTVVEEVYRQLAVAYRGVTQIDPSGRRPSRVDAGSTGGDMQPPRSPNTDTCRWRCPFTEPCLAGRKGADIRGLLAEQGFRQDFTRH